VESIRHSIAEEGFPGADAVDELASDGCLERFESFVGRDYESSTLDFFTMYPTRDSWTRLDDRQVICALYDLNLAKLEGSVRGLRL